MLSNFLQVIQFLIRENGPKLSADQDIIIIIKAGRSFDPKLLSRSRTRKKKKEKNKK